MDHTEQPTCVCVIACNEHGQVLTVETTWENRGHGLPGGMVDPGETPEFAAERELREESGLVPLEPLRLVYLARTKRNTVATYFTKASGQPISSHEGIASWQDPKVLCDSKNLYHVYNTEALKAARLL